MGPRKAVAWLALLTMASLVGWACSGPTASPTPADTDVAVALQEWAVVPSVATAPSGEVTFTVTNQGPDDIHEFVVIKTDLSVHELPTGADGAVDEEGGGMVVVDEIEDIPVGETQDLAVNLEAGAYALICNIYEQTENESHYQLGMRTAFTVTE
jgi:uncharacterized cupredoxin-like copper-binding protein